MASGTLDSNGIWLYGEDDPASPVSDLLNLGMDSVSDAVGDAKARLTVLEVAAPVTAWSVAGGSPVSSGALVRGANAPAVMGNGVSVFKITVTMGAAYSTVSGDTATLAVLRTNNAVVYRSFIVPLTGAWGASRTFVVTDVPPAGSMTYAIGWQRTTGTGSCSVQDSLIIVEKIT